MAKLTINLPDNTFARDVDSNAKFYGYQDIIQEPDGTGIPNPQTKQDFLEQTFKRMLKENSKSQRTMDAIKNLNIEE